MKQSCFFFYLKGGIYLSDKSYEDYLEEQVKKTAKKLSRNQREYYQVYQRLEKKKEMVLNMQTTKPSVKLSSDDIIGVGTNVSTIALDNKYQAIIQKELPEITPARTFMPATILVSGYNVAKEANKKDGDPFKQTTIEAASVGTTSAATSMVTPIASGLLKAAAGVKYTAWAGPIGILAGAIGGYVVSKYGDTWYEGARKYGEEVHKKKFHPFINQIKDKEGNIQYTTANKKKAIKYFGTNSKAVKYGAAMSAKDRQNELREFQKKRAANNSASKKSAPKKKDNFFSRLKKQLWGLFKHNANGSFVDNPMLSWVGEEGPEVIIPLSGHKRDRGLDLWQQAGQALGVTGYANGGTAGGVPGKQSPPGIGQAKGGIRVSVGNINLSLKSSGGGGKSTNLLSALKEQKEEVSDELCNILADALESAYQNIPAVS